MTGLVRKATLLTVGGLMLAGVAMASVPSPANCVIQPIAFVGRDGASGVADPQTAYFALPPASIVNNQITVRDAGNLPVAGSSVVIDFQPCNTADIRLCSVQTQPGLSVLCSGGLRNVTLSASGLGVARFSIIGHSNNGAGAVVGATAACAKVYADGVLLGTVKVSEYDEDGIGGVGGSDLFSFFADQASTTPIYPAMRSDYDGNGSIGGTDLFLFFTIQGSGASNASCAAALCIP